MEPLQETYKGSAEISYDGSPMQEEQVNMERVVISGMSGLFPESENIKDFTDILYNKINPVISENSRWTVEHPELPKHQGVIPNVEKFDAQFFKVHYQLGISMDSMSRKLLEQTYQAIYDAGINPKQLWGKKVGVFIGTTSFSETESDAFLGFKIIKPFGLTGCSKAMFANRISYWLDSSAPSISVDALCSSSMVALQRAYNAINSGECESAVVGGTSICHHFQSVVNCGRVIPLCKDGKTRSFDKNANGCARSEAISVLFLQKAKDAKRIYAEVCYINNHYGPMSNELGQVFGPYRDEETLTNFLREFYTKAGIQPGVVEFVEAFGTAASEADRCELQALSNVLCKERKSPLLVGSVISNIGYTEAASGICSVIKVLLGFHTGQLAANLHCDDPRDDVEALREGRMRIVTEHQRFNRSYAAVNSMSLGGDSLHLLLKGQNKHKDLSQFHSCIPYLVTVSGRQETGVQKILDELKANPLDPEQIGLLHNIHEESISGHLSRGFVLLEKINDNETKCIKESTDYFDDIKRQLWFVYSGMGSQWVGMGQHLMQIPVFAASIERCQNVLEPKGIDIKRIITCPESTLDNILHCFVGICAVQIGLTDVLQELGIVPEKIIGHSAGELVCAYADGCLTAEETILSSYSRGLVSLQIPFIHGSMAAVGLGYKEIVSICPPEIEVACHNSAKSCTISGPSEVMREFVVKLTAQGIFAKEVPCSNIAYHSRYIKEAGPVLLKCLEDVIKSPKLRSEKWLSTSVPQDKWDEAAAKFSSAEYHTNNLLNPVLFEETSKLIPSNAVLIEVAPHGLLQAILKRSLPASCIYLPLTRRGHPDNALFMLEAIGKLYMQGYNPQIKNLYKQIDFPVSSGTPHLSHLVEWVHEEKWMTPGSIINRKKIAAAANFVISLYNDEHKYLKGFNHGNETLYPFSGALVCVWDTLAMSLGERRRNLSVEFHDIYLHEQPVLIQDEPLRLRVQLQRGDGYFKVKSKDTNIISGYVLKKEERKSNELTIDDQDSKGRMLSSEDVYKIFHSRSSQYSGEFRSIKGLNEEMTRAKISWTGNWVTLLDSMLQLNALRRDYEGITVPRFIRRLYIDIQDHKSYSTMNDGSFNVHFDKLHGVSRCAGVTIKDLRFSNLPPLPLKPLALKLLKFIPFVSHSKLLKTAEAVNVFLQIISENLDKNIINVVDIQNCKNYTIRKEIEGVTTAELAININTINSDNITSKDEVTLRTADLLVVTNMQIKDHICDLLCGTAPPDIFMLSTQQSETVSMPKAICRTVASAATPLGRLVLSRWRPAPIPVVYDTISVNYIDDLVMLASTKQKLTADKRLVVISSYPPPNGLKEMVKSWRRESNHIKIYVAMIKHTNEGITKDTVAKIPDFDLTFNTYDDNAWGGHYFVSKDEFYLNALERITLSKNTVPGDFNTLHWEEAAEPESNQVKVTVYYAGLNGRDAKRVSGTVPYIVDDESDHGYGMDYSGLTDSGERVMGVIRGGAASSCVAAEPSMLWPVPAHWTLEDAATVPLPYAHAFYCLGIKCHLQPRTRLLVHGATGALGLAVISIALAYNCTVFATVSDMKKKRFLRKMFPTLPDEYIGSSRNDAFCDMIVDKTRGAGCDFVISCLDGDLKDGSMKCLSDSGIAIDTHQLPSRDNYQFGMFHLTRARHYIPVDFASIFKTKNSDEMREIQLIMCEGIKRGYVRPLPRVTFEPSDVQHAFQLLAARCHRGRVLLNFHDKILSVTPRLSISSKNSHLIISATSNDVIIGKIVDVLIERGAKNIVINHDKEVTNGYIDIQIKKWEKHGVQVKLNNIKLVDEKSVELVVNACNNLGPIESVYFINTETADDKMKLTNFQINNLDIITRKQCPNIRIFAVINGESNVGQNICINRSIDKLPSTMLNLPKLTKFGDESLKVSQGLPYNTAVDAIEQAIRSSSPVVFAHAMPLNTPTNHLLNRISTLAGINIQDRLPNETTLRKSEQNSRVNNLETQATKDNQTAVGLNVLFNNVDEDVLLATKDLILMPTAVNSSAEPDDILDSKETYLILVPGFNGHHNDFFILCEQLKLPAVVLQPGLDHPYETVTEMTARLSKVIIDKIKPKKDFYLLGYSFGVQIALEIAAILEDQGLDGVVFCVDASPDTFSATLNSWLCEAGATDEVRLQDAIVKHMYGLMTGGESLRLQLELHEGNTWPFKVDAFLRALRGQITHSSQYARALIEATYSRIKQARLYDAQRLHAHPLRSLLVVLRSSSQPASVESDLGLSRYSVRTPQIYNLSKDHAHALEDLRCANIINKHLSKNIVDTFENRNLCETYY